MGASEATQADMVGTHRRAFIAAGLAAAAVALAPIAALPSTGEALQGCLASLASDRESYREVGRLYRVANPALPGPAALRRAFAGAAGGEPLFLLALSVAERRRWFSGVCRREFARGDVEPFGGWLFAASELQLAALLAA